MRTSGAAGPLPPPAGHGAGGPGGPGGGDGGRGVGATVEGQWRREEGVDPTLLAVLAGLARRPRAQEAVGQVDDVRSGVVRVGVVVPFPSARQRSGARPVLLVFLQGLALGRLLAPVPAGPREGLVGQLLHGALQAVATGNANAFLP